MRTIYFSKSKYAAGLQCPKRLWLICHTPELATPSDAGATAIADAGTAIGQLAHRLFPGGVLVSEEPWRHAEAMVRTQVLMADPTIPAIFEGAFEFDGVRIRADVLERLGDGTWRLCEVKSSTSVKDEYIDDVAVQRFVLEGTGVRLTSVQLIHIDRAYVRGPDGIDPLPLFVRADIDPAVSARFSDVAGIVAALRIVVAREAAPAVEPSPHCMAPRECTFWAHCTRDKPDDWIWYLPGLRGKQFASLRAAGIERIPDLVDDGTLPALWQRALEVHRAGRPFVSPTLPDALAPIGPPVDFLDFETANPGIPLYEGLRPYDQVPFQWSLHRLDGEGRLSHHEFLADGATDPRRAFAESLPAALADSTAPILVWSPFEATRLRELARAFPEHRDGLVAVCGRLVDLLPVVSANLYHAAFAGSFSLKTVAPALLPNFGYGDLDGVADGGAAADALVRLAVGQVPPEEVGRLRKALLRYCERDTLATVKLHRALWALAAD